MIPEEIELKRQIIIHRKMMMEMSDYANMMKGHEITMIENKVAM